MLNFNKKYVCKWKIAPLSLAGTAFSPTIKISHIKNESFDPGKVYNY
jgi:hypothetical protein